MGSFIPFPLALGGPRNYKDNYIFFWNNVGLDLNRITHTNSGHQSGPPLSARYLGILHLAIHDAYLATFPYSEQSDAMEQFADDFRPFLSASAFGTLFKAPAKRDPGVSQSTATLVSDFIDASSLAYQQAHGLSPRSSAYAFGAAIANLILDQLEIKGSEPGVDAGGYMPNSNQPYFFDDDPSHPICVRPIDPNAPERGNKIVRPYHAPSYGTSAAVSATTEDIKITDPPLVPSNPPSLETDPTAEHLKYLEALEDVRRMGGAEDLASTKRQPAQTVGAVFWAYDGVNLIGTPPRLYNQVVKQIAFDAKVGDDISSDENNAQFVRLLALVNVAMADVGVFFWRDKYKYELWRPLTGVHADPSGPVPGGSSRPTWRVLGAPATNSNEGGFKPPFPAHSSGNATFGAAAFQMARLFYDQRDVVNDTISYKFISDELNGVSRNLYSAYDPKLPLESQAGDVRTRVPITYNSLKEAISANEMSRVWLGVHWHFDGFAGETVDRKQLFKVAEDDSTVYQHVGGIDWFAAGNLGPRDGAGEYPVGGVPLGMLIADNIFDNKMQSSGPLSDLGKNVELRRN
ncbi:uncharacterized protein MYCGRDRAFT_86416 [Zymoseptoria tritici IPO323]|uniref:Vanadium chloroperoxidase N-terminal domain-containing protein n=1 Tax=Zymoseptoria tritici (strain CBS 115943 / IPO323) TaxID=336722 RepID=F9XCW4_ZYMTI|nr:uncharacterized protein MYCGRDRAFT_86416 [Zymoseptoria tritici IPO323]EGP86899.1 hypothetical protein MYCGRDRAFT_86416 [Zymoseptoria tritici IPO323]